MIEHKILRILLDFPITIGIDKRADSDLRWRERFLEAVAPVGDVFNESNSFLELHRTKPTSQQFHGLRFELGLCLKYLL